jgi:hypothetical protein
MLDKDLRERLFALSFDDPAGEPFLSRLMREHGWTEAFALRAIDEYKRFLYLAATGKPGLVPPKAVDQVWHLHLLYTRSYWDDLCRCILGRPLHHDPSPGGHDAAREGRAGYERTLSNYRLAFGEPPSDIWTPLPVERRERRVSGGCGCSCNFGD